MYKVKEIRSNPLTYDTTNKVVSFFIRDKFIKSITVSDTFPLVNKADEQIYEDDCIFYIFHSIIDLADVLKEIKINTIE